MTSYGVGLNEVKWVVTGYMLAYAVLMPATGWARDTFGSKRTFLFSLAVFTIGSLLCGLAWNNTTLVLARVVQAIGGGAIMPTGMTLITEVFEPHERGSAIGIWGLGAIIAPALGPTLGGFIVDTIGWRWIFFVNIPVGIGGILAAQAYLREGARHPKPFDFQGFSLLAVAIVTLLFAVAEGQSWGWTSAPILACFGVGLFSLLGFLKYASGRQDAILDLALFKIRNFWTSATLGLSRSVALFGSTFLLPVYLQHVAGISATHTGLLMMPGAIAIGISMPLVGRLSDRIGARLPAIAGILLASASVGAFYWLRPDTGAAGVIVPLVLRGFGVGMLMAPVTAAAMNALPSRSIGMGSGMLNLIQQIGGAAGISLLEGIVQYRSAMYRLQGAASVAAEGHAYNDAFFVAGLVVFLGIVPALLLQNVRGRRQEIVVAE
jgi:DHA2 family multidrug resistance protein